MIEIFTDPTVIKIITLGDIWFWIAILFSVIIAAFQSARYSKDPVFRSMNFSISIASLIFVILVNVLLTQRAGAAIPRPILIGGPAYDVLVATAKSGLNIPTNGIMQKLLYDNLFRNIWPSLIAITVIIFLGTISARNAPPRWVPGLGIDIVQSDIPNIIDYSINSFIRMNIFSSSVLIFSTVVFFDLTHLASIVQKAGNPMEPPLFFQNRSFDMNFFVCLVLCPIFLIKSYQCVWVAKYKMIRGGLTGYRPERLRVHAAMYRKYEATIEPAIGLPPEKSPEVKNK